MKREVSPQVVGFWKKGCSGLLEETGTPGRVVGADDRRRGRTANCHSPHTSIMVVGSSVAGLLSSHRRGVRVPPKRSEMTCLGEAKAEVVVDRCGGNSPERPVLEPRRGTRWSMRATSASTP